MRRNNRILWFRGHADERWKLVPALGRDRKLAIAEQNLIRRFKQNAVGLLDKPPDHEWNWMFLMQHHRLPTRLLDWSESPLVGLYFSVRDRKFKRRPGALWCLDPVKLNRGAEIDFENDFEIPAFGEKPLENYEPSKIAMERASSLLPVAGLAARSNDRIYAQMGTFTVSHRKFFALESIPNSPTVKLIVPPAAKAQLCRELDHLRVNDLTMFPELDSVSRLAAEDSR